MPAARSIRPAFAKRSILGVLLVAAGFAPWPGGGGLPSIGAASAATQPSRADGFDAGDRFVIRQRDGTYHYATVERRFRERGFEMLRYRWSAGHRQGGGTIPLAERDQKRIFTLEQARERGFEMANTLPEREVASDSASSDPVAEAGPGSGKAPAKAAAKSRQAGTRDGLTQAEQTEMLDAHNRWRRADGVPEVSWSAALAGSAQQWAGQIERTRQCSIDASAHSDDPGYGENLAWRSALRYGSGKTEIQPATPAEIANDWASEKKNYDHASNSCRSVCGHYTQMVWQSTREIGCGHAVCDNLSQVWVCHYAPPGNYIGQKPY